MYMYKAYTKKCREDWRANCNHPFMQIKFDCEFFFWGLESLMILICTLQFKPWTRKNTCIWSDSNKCLSIANFLMIWTASLSKFEGLEVWFSFQSENRIIIVKILIGLVRRAKIEVCGKQCILPLKISDCSLWCIINFFID